ncbi:MAG: cytochrome c oxidase accessory protein CcoG [Ignavibacteria bacterium CG2_30_36_16]|nr:cytochrome c oxidase accessory protein CcoG [Ignavibacteria bacterium]OIP54767.1 MAG: cytochrome c oxidase accessory protein CcoG [Ignavibacteria bacterium CG2_30_36_16]PJB00883.1 MAG: cytochrome c oxidase accessory protein CcoG [Ignavibacteria bacterium CG_4_9_14_3_um_filter_36_18]
MKKNEEVAINDSFRDSIATVDEEGKRKWIYPKKPSGKFYNARTIVSLILLAILIVTPLIKINGRPLILFNVLERNFILLGIPFGPHDFLMFALAMIAIIVFVILFTAIFGRVFCGWACPQTIFMEMVFRKVEYWIEGDARQQRNLSAAPWSGSKTVKKIFKYFIFFVISFLVANIFLSYIIGADRLLQIVTQPPSANLKGFISVFAFSIVFYFVFAYFREQACTIVCPYGRLQGVLLDRDSVVIAYDYRRGEPRSKIKKNEDQTDAGDCIDCKLCVDVCPTGIDIRDGIQLECVNCTACIDECDSVMEKVNRPKKLIKYASINGIENNSKFRFTPRAVAYSILLLVIISALAFLLMSRTDFSINILRTPGMLYQVQPGGLVSNLYDLNMVNKTFEEMPVELKLEGADGEIKLIGKEITLKPQGIVDAKFMLLLPKGTILKMNTPVTIGIYTNGRLIKKVNTSFLAPIEGLGEKEGNG